MSRQFRFVAKRTLVGIWLSRSLPAGDAHDGLADLQVLLVDLLLELVEGWARPRLELGGLTRLLHAAPHRHAPEEESYTKFEVDQ